MNINHSSYELNIYLIYWLTLWYRSRANVSCWLGLKLKWRADSTLNKFLCYQRDRTNSFSFLFFEMLSIPINCSFITQFSLSIFAHLVVSFGCLFPVVHCFLFPIATGVNPPRSAWMQVINALAFPSQRCSNMLCPHHFISFASFDPRDYRRLTAHCLQYLSSPAITSFFYVLFPISASSPENLHCDGLTPPLITAHECLMTGRAALAFTLVKVGPVSAVIEGASSWRTGRKGRYQYAAEIFHSSQVSCLHHSVSHFSPECSCTAWG